MAKLQDRTILINGDMWTIRLSDESDTVSMADRGNWGECSNRNQVISICADQNSTRKMLTLLHEIGHVFYHEIAPLFGIDQDESVNEEAFCEAFARFNWQLIRDNKDLRGILDK